MGMSVGNGKRSLADPNVVPLIDILLVLIIIFMVIQPPAKSTGHNAQLPLPADDSTNSLVPPDTAVIVQVLDGGALRINDEPHTWASLGPRLDVIFKQRAEKVAFVKGDDSVLFQEIARAIDVMRSSGINRVGLVTAKISVRH
jgi:biopolymer transport protein ExbD